MSATAQKNAEAAAAAVEEDQGEVLWSLDHFGLFLLNFESGPVVKSNFLLKYLFRVGQFLLVPWSRTALGLQTSRSWGRPGTTLSSPSFMVRKFVHIRLFHCWVSRWLALNKMQHHFWHLFLTQFLMLFHMVTSVLLSMVAFFQPFSDWWKLLNSQSDSLKQLLSGY